jgi:transcriptional regulator with XRE-family HTH domain
LEALRHIRTMCGMNQVDLAKASGVAQNTISEIELGKREARPGTLKKLADALGVGIADLLGDTLPKAPAPKALGRSSLEPTLLNGLEDERRAAWEAAVDEARRLRETGWAQMWKALSGWRASKQRGEPYATRREYLDEMGNLLQEVYDADGALGWAYIEAALTTQGGSEASGPSYLREQSRTTGHFYGELLGLVKSAGLSVRTGSGEVRGKDVTPEERPRGVEENPAA